MKKNVGSRLFSFILGAIIFGGIGVVSAYTFLASDTSFTPKDTGWEVDNVEDALNDIHRIMNTTAFKKVCHYVNSDYSKDTSDKYSIGTKYECDPGDGVKRNFYILKTSGEKVDLIMEENIAKGTMDWYSAMKYFRTGAGTSIKASWTNVQEIDLPKAQDIADAVGRTSWIAAENNSWWCLESHKQDSSSNPYCYNNDGNLETLWLWDYTRECSSWKCEHSLNSEWAYGYWTRDAILNTALAWRVSRNGSLSYDTASYSTFSGVRPVITVYRSNL